MKVSDYLALAEFRYQLRRFVSFSEQAARAAGLEPKQHQLLLALKGSPAGNKPTVGWLAERLQLQHHSAGELIDRLESRGLARRLRSEQDRRKVRVLVTPRGEKVLNRLSVHHLALLRSAGPDLVRALQEVINGSNARTKPPAKAPPRNKL